MINNILLHYFTIIIVNGVKLHITLYSVATVVTQFDSDKIVSMGKPPAHQL